jgi:uncharacterized protein YjdB
MKTNGLLHYYSRPASLSLLAVIVTSLAVVEPGSAGFNQFSIGLNFGSNDGNNGTGARALAATDIAGLPAVAQGNWNNMPGVSGTSSDGSVLDNNGAATTAGVIWTSALGTWSSGGNNGFPADSPDHTLMMGYLDNGATATVTLTNLPSQLTAGGYDVYVYALFDTPNRGGTYSIVDGTNSATVLRAAVPLNSDTGPTNYVQSPGLSTSYTGNYLVFHGLTNRNIQLVAVATNTGTARAPICGMQLVAAPAPGEAGRAVGLQVATNGLEGQLVLTWTNGANSQGALVVMRQGLPVTAQPVDGQAYPADAGFGRGANLGDDELGFGNYVVFAGSTSGTRSSVTVSNLTPTLRYYAAVYSTTGSGATLDYTLATPATTNGVALGTATGLTLTVPSPVTAGSARRFSVLANFLNGTAADVTSLASVTSSNTSIVSIQAAGRLAAQSTGTVGLKAIYQTMTNIQLVTVTSVAMTYQFSFDEPPGSTTVTDRVAGAVGTVFNSPFTSTDGNGRLIFDGSGGYVALPANILTNYGGLTMEFWATEATAPNWIRFWDFGSGTTVNMFMTPAAGGPTLRTAFTVGGGGAETQVNYPFTADLNAQHQYAFTLSGATRLARLYLDGILVGVNTNFLLTPEDAGPTGNNWLGRSQYAADPYFNGNMAEFRIYNGPLDAFTIALNAATGPDVITNTPGALNSLTVTAASPMTEFASEQATATGTFANVANPVNLTTAPQTTWSTSDPNILRVDAQGLLTATGAGTATVKAVAFGVTNTAQVVVLALPLGMRHRWTFNTDFSDVLNPSAPAVPHGTVAVDGSGNAVLDGSGAANATSGSYIELPVNSLLGNSVTLEAWYTDQAGDGTGINRNWCRIWDFGSGPGNNLWLTPFVGGEVDTMRCALNINNAGEWTINCARPLTNVEHHVVFVLDSTNHAAYFYVDGLLAAQNRDFQARPRDMGLNQNDWLGRSQYGDPLFAGLINEFRIYNGILDPVQVGLDYATGPNNIVTSPGALSSVSVALSPNMVAGNQQPAQVLASFASVPNVPVTSAAGNWTSSDPSVARVDNYGRVTATGPGTASISATFRSVTGSATVNVTAATPPLLTHRYNFNNGDAADSVGSANGTVVGTSMTFANGMATIVDNNGYVQLPGHLFDTNLEVTLETWCVVASTSGSGARLADFGTSGNSGGVGRTAFAIAPTANGNNYISFRQSPNDAIGTPSINSYGRPAFGTTNHYAFVVSDINRRIDFYLNGELKDSFPYSTQPDQLMGGNVQFPKMLGYQLNNMTEGWFGLNVGATTGSGWRGSIDEFRIWSGAMNKLQAKMSYLAGPNSPQIDPGAAQTLAVALSDTTMVVGTLQHPTVTATFANAAGSFDLTGLPAVLFTSDNPAAVAVVNGGDSKLQAQAPGTAHIVTAYGGLKVTNTVTVIAKPAAILTHRYSFRANANDAVGHANGKLFGNAAIGATSLVLDGSLNPSSYLQLPADLISGYDLATFEVFYAASAGSSGSQQRLWDFGDHVIANGGITGAGYLYEAAGRGAVGMPNATPGAGETAAIAPSSNRSSFTTNTVHVVVTVDSINHILSIYTNGNFSISATNAVVDLGLVVDKFSFLGRSQWGDPHYAGTIDEFRLYYGMLTPAQISASYAFGADPEKLTVVQGPGAGQVTILWPASLVTEGATLQANSSLSAPNWGPAGAGTVVNGYNQLIVNTGPTPAFYRLIK